MREKFSRNGCIRGPRGRHTCSREVISMDNRSDYSNSNPNGANKHNSSSETKKQQNSESRKNNSSENKNSQNKGY